MIAAAAGVALGLTVAMINLRIPAFNGLLLLPAMYAAIAAHEAGHLICGKMAGLDSGGVAIGGFLFLRSGQFWKLRFDWRGILGGGFAKPLMRGRGEIRRGQLILMIAGGPIVSAVLTVMSGWAVYRYGAGAGAWAVSFFLVSGLITCLSLFPYRGGGMKSDGMQLWQLLRYEESTANWNALLTLQTAETTGALPRDWDAQAMEYLHNTNPEDAAYSHYQLLAYCRALDQGKENEAAMYLENALRKSAKSSRATRHLLYLEAASTSALYRKNAQQARIWLRRASKLRKPESPHAVEAAIAMCEGRYGEALEHLAQAREFLIRRRLDSGLARFAKEKWAERERQCREAICSREEQKTPSRF